MPNSEPARVSLEPCPFCGGEARLEHRYQEDDVHPPRDFWHVRIHCDCDMASTGWLSYGNQEQKVANYHVRLAAEAAAIAAWNRRTPPTSPGWQDYERGLEDAARAAEKAWPRAHTYASENADLYRAQDHVRDKIATAIRALATKEKV